MKHNRILLIALPFLFGCASEPPVQQGLNFSPVGKTFKSAAAQKSAFRVAEAKCRAYGMQVAAGVPNPAMQRPSYVNIQTAPVFVGGTRPLPTPYAPDARGAIAAYQAGEASGFRSQLASSSALACMAEEGWVVE